MVTHDAGAAAVADRVLYLADGLIVGTQERPSADDILDQLKALR
jgi:putative ABC transport system ATP-binding protein